MSRSKILTYAFAGCSVIAAYLMIRYPQIAVGGTVEGLKIWWANVFPALFPFFVLTELMIGFGVVNFAGVLMEPVMRAVFRLPGVSGFVFMMGMVSGFPAGARITAQLYKEKKISKEEAERMASFTNFSNPLFLFGVTAAGFFDLPSLGVIFALSHYIGNICVGLIMRFAGSGRSSEREKARLSLHIFSQALNSMHQERLRRRQPFGKKMGDAVIASVNTLLAIGGFIALFSMIYHLLLRVGAIHLLSSSLSAAFRTLSLTPALGPAVIPGLFELTIGDHKVAETAAPLIERVVTVSGLLGFCGFSIQAQAAAILSQAGLSARLFFIGRLIQMFCSSAAAYVLFHFFQPGRASERPAIFVFEQPFDQFVHQTASSGSLITVAVLLTFIAILIKRLHDHQSDG